MATNNDLLTALQNFENLQKLNPSLRNKAFNDVLAVDPTNEKAFKQALLNNKAFWNRLLPKIFESFDLKRDEVPPFHELQQLIAEQAIKLNLSRLQDAELEDIFKKNEATDELRDYLGGLKSLQVNLTESPRWKGGHKNLVLNTTNGIKEQAAQELLSRYISNETDLKILTAFRNEPNDLNARLLRFPSEALASLKKDAGKIKLSADIDQLLKERHGQLVLDEFKKQVNSKPAAQLNGEGENVTSEQKLETFLTDNVPSNTLSSAQVNEAKTFFLRRYLESKLSGLSFSDLEAKLKLTNAQLESEAITDHTEYALKKVQYGTYREILLKELLKIVTDEKILIKLSNHTNVDSFKSQLAQYAFADLDSLSVENMRAVQRTIRQRAFELKTKGRRPLLVEAFCKLPDDKQREILADPKQLNALMNARTRPDIEKLLAREKNDPLVQSIREEKRNLELFRSIHNPELAKILENFHPPIPMDGEKLKKINQALQNPSDYVSFVNELIRICEIKATDTATFKQKFWIDPSNDAIKPPEKKQDGSDVENSSDLIGLQLHYNKTLLEKLKEPLTSKADKHLMGFLCTLNKTEEFDDASIDQIKNMLHSSANISEFREKLKANQDFASLDPQLDNFYAEENFREIKKLNRADRIANASNEPLEGLQALMEIDRTLERMEKRNVHLKDFFEGLKSIHSIQSSRIHHVFQKNTKHTRAKEEEFKGAAKTCEVNIDILKRELNTLEDYNNETYLPQAPRLEIDREKVLTTVRQQKEKISQLLKEHEDLQIKLAQIQEDIRIAKQGGYTMQGKIKGFFISTQGADKPYEVEVKAAAQYVRPASSTGVVVRTHKKPYELELVKNLALGQTRTYVYGQEGAEERFSQSLELDGDGDVDIQFKVDCFPAANPADGNSGRVEYAMGLAMAILNSMPEPPSKTNRIIIEGKNQEEIAYIYSALLALGKEDPKFGPEAINCTNAPADKYSLYKNEFESNPVCTAVISDYQQQVQAKNGTKKEDTWEASSKALGASEYKAPLQDLRRAGEEHIEKHGSAELDDYKRAEHKGVT